ncbi:IS3 family transposase [Neoroseomonas oryzicola]|uniref:IS3 family transposase n=1 Tax=Neoroseomonas oryzicola TaxID=535904 RepID=UPI0038CFCD35
MTDASEKVEVITSVQRRRRWSAAEKMRMVEESLELGASVSLVARRHGVNPNQPFTWRRLAAHGAFTAAAAGEEVVPASDYRALQEQIRELHHLLGKKTLEAEILREALQHADPKKGLLARATAAARRFPVKAVARTLGVACSSLAPKPAPARRRGRPPAPEDDLLARITAIVAALPSYGYRRVHALLRRQAEEVGQPSPNHKRVWRIMKAHGLLLARHAGGTERRHDGRVAVPERNNRWCSDGFEIACDNGERVRVALALDCCDREAMSFVGTTAGISGDDLRDLMVAAVERRFGRVNRLPQPIEWLSDNGSPYAARDTRTFARDIGLLPKTTPLESPQSSGMAEAFARTFKHDYVRVGDCADAQTALRSLPAWFTHYNEVHPHRALGYRSPKQFIRAILTT